MPRQYRYDVFLSHASKDRTLAEPVAEALRDRGLHVFYDAWALKPGMPWQAALEEALFSARTLVVLVGPDGIGPWAREELAAGFQRQVSETEFRIIPVLLPGASTDNLREIPFLASRTFVDLRDMGEAGLHQLMVGIQGVPPGAPTVPPGRRPAAPKVFLCHAQEDAERVEQLYYSLQDEGLDPWYDKKKLLIGDRWEAEILAAIEQSDFFAICLSPRSVRKRGFIWKEIRTAVREYQRRPESVPYLLPIRIEECTVPAIKLDDTSNLRGLQWQDVFEGDTEAIRDLANGILQQWVKTTQS
jgi:hypothetical protein